MTALRGQNVANFSVTFPTPKGTKTEQFAGGLAAYKIASSGVLTIQYASNRSKQHHFAPGCWLEVADGDDPIL